MDTKSPERTYDETPAAPERAPVVGTTRTQKALTLAAAVAFAAALVVLASAAVVSRQAAEREARVFGASAATAFREGACDRALRLLVAGLPGRGALPFSFQSRPLQNDLSFFGSARDCAFRLALAGHTGLVSGAARTALRSSRRPGTARRGCGMRTAEPLPPRFRGTNFGLTARPSVLTADALSPPPGTKRRGYGMQKPVRFWQRLPVTPTG